MVVVVVVVNLHHQEEEEIEWTSVEVEEVTEIVETIATDDPVFGLGIGTAETDVEEEEEEDETMIVEEEDETIVTTVVVGALKEGIPVGKISTLRYLVEEVEEAEVERPTDGREA